MAPKGTGLMKGGPARLGHSSHLSDSPEGRTACLRLTKVLLTPAGREGPHGARFGSLIPNSLHLGGDNVNN